MENIGVGHAFSDFGDLSMERNPVGFMDLLGVPQDITRHVLIHEPLMQSPGRPNLSSSEAVTGEEKKRDNEEDEHGEEQQRKRTQGSEKSSKQTKMKVQKVSFITKSEVLHLEDGYKWRKYGQKPVKNSPFPRHYYRCTTSSCNVKKRVERSFSDPSTVITTYEGQHTHPRPLFISKTGSFGSTDSAPGSHFALPTHPSQLFHYNSQQQELSFSGTNDDHHVMKKSPSRDLLDETGLVKDNGLLQDVVSSHIIKQ